MSLDQNNSLLSSDSPSTSFNSISNICKSASKTNFYDLIKTDTKYLRSFNKKNLYDNDLSKIIGLTREEVKKIFLNNIKNLIQIEEFNDAFKLFDKDGDGRVTASELGIVMQSLGHTLTNQELINLICEIDEDSKILFYKNIINNLFQETVISSLKNL